MTHAERLLWLAELEIECPLCEGGRGVVIGRGQLLVREGSSDTPALEGEKGFGLIRCPSCGGSAKVPRFPLPRSKCVYWGCSGSGLMTIWNDEKKVEDFPYLTPEKVRCSSCKGRGWVPLDSLEAILLCAQEWGFKVEGNQIWANCRLLPHLRDYSANEVTLNEAAVLALYKAAGGSDG